MSKRLEEIALRKKLLQARSDLHRLELRGELQSVWGGRRGIGGSSSMGSWLLGTALGWLGRGGVGQGLAFTSTALLLLKLVRVGIGLFRKPEESKPTPG